VWPAAPSAAASGKMPRTLATAHVVPQDRAEIEAHKKPEVPACAPVAPAQAAQKTVRVPKAHSHPENTPFGVSVVSIQGNRKGSTLMLLVV
jgi:hypothetical protein